MTSDAHPYTLCKCTWSKCQTKLHRARYGLYGKTRSILLLHMPLLLPLPGHRRPCIWPCKKWQALATSDNGLQSNTKLECKEKYWYVHKCMYFLKITLHANNSGYLEPLYRPSSTILLYKLLLNGEGLRLSISIAATTCLQYNMIFFGDHFELWLATTLSEFNNTFYIIGYIIFPKLIKWFVADLWYISNQYILDYVHSLYQMLIKVSANGRICYI